MTFRISTVVFLFLEVLQQNPLSRYGVVAFPTIHSHRLKPRNQASGFWSRRILHGGKGKGGVVEEKAESTPAEGGPVNEITPMRDCQLPIDWYTSEEIYNLEQEFIFRKMPQYIGHELMVPQPRDFHTLEWMGNAKVLMNNGDKRDKDTLGTPDHGCGIDLLSNICRHRQAVMLKGSGRTQNILCPLHRWSFTSEGKFLGAPHFEREQRESECKHLHLQQTPLHNWRGLLMASPPSLDETMPGSSSSSLINELNTMSCRSDLDFSDYTYSHSEVTQYHFNWKTFIEVYLEDYHVGPFHPGLNGFVDCDQLAWEFSENFSVQTVGSRRRFKENFGTPVYENWQREVLNKDESLMDRPKYGAIWLVVYPLLMVEWYPKTLVVSHIIPEGPHKCKNVVEFYYPQDIVLHQKEYIQAQQRAYMETAVEDEEICQRMHDGRVALSKLGLDERGPYQHPMESGLQHFHQWMHKMLDRHVVK